MPTQTLSANSYIYFTFAFQGRFFRDARIRFYVESELPISTFIVDESGFGEFQSGREYTYYGGFSNITEHRQEFRVPHEGVWYLIVSNNQNMNTAIHYEVS